MKLSSSNGTQLTIEELTKACELLNRARTRIKEINKGKYNDLIHYYSLMLHVKN